MCSGGHYQNRLLHNTDNSLTLSTITTCQIWNLQWSLTSLPYTCRSKFYFSKYNFVHQ